MQELFTENVGNGVEKNAPVVWGILGHLLIGHRRGTHPPISYFISTVLYIGVGYHCKRGELVCKHGGGIFVHNA